MDPKTFQKINLAVCLLGLALLVFVLVKYGVQIALAKKELKSQGKIVPKLSGKLIASLIFSAGVVMLPIFIWFRQFYVTAVLEGCGVLGAAVVLRERLASLKE